MNLKIINPDLLKNYLINQKSPIEELDLFKRFYPDVPFELTDYNFFKAHFLIHHSLYKLKEDLNEQRYLLFIQLSSIHIIKFPEAGYCSWFSESEASFCSNSSKDKYCTVHEKEHRVLIDGNIIDSDPLQVYYSNLKNLEQLDEQSFRLFADSGIYLAENIIKVQKALDIFALHPTTTFSRITERFRYLVKKSHPDKAVDSDYSFQEIKEAYDVLANWKNRGKTSDQFK